jgi:hypothetical protein
MAIKYVPHNRQVSQNQIDTYGKLATHDIETEAPLLATGMTVPDVTGKLVEVDEKLLRAIKDGTNAWIRERYDNPLIKARSYVLSGLDNNEFISVIKDHEQKIDNKIGTNKGLFYIRKIEGIPTLMSKLLITSLSAKSAIDGVDGKNLISNLSIKSINNVIKEISAVVREGAPGAGLLLSEPENAPEKPNEILNLEFKLAELDTSIEKHTIVAHMIKTGKVIPADYDELMLSETSVLEQINRCTVARDLGLTLGTSRLPQPIRETDMDKLNKYLESQGEKPLTADEAIQYTAPSTLQLEERDAELNRVLELMRSNPAHAEKYLQFELGEKYTEKYLPDNTLKKLINKRKELSNQILILQERE